jgi:pimeloyl-ACP methyl ester carboxylesterase
MIHQQGHRDVSQLSPDAWTVDLASLARPHAHRAQLDLFYDYRTNVPLYPQWQAFLREHRPKTLILWGKNDIFFTPEGGQAYLRDLPEAELHMLDSGHFAVEDSLEEIAAHIKRFHEEKVAGRAGARALESAGSTR